MDVTAGTRNGAERAEAYHLAKRLLHAVRTLTLGEGLSRARRRDLQVWEQTIPPHDLTRQEARILVAGMTAIGRQLAKATTDDVMRADIELVLAGIRYWHGGASSVPQSAEVLAALRRRTPQLESRVWPSS